MKKVYQLILVILLITTVFIGCEKTTDNENQQQLTNLTENNIINDSNSEEKNEMETYAGKSITFDYPKHFNLDKNSNGDGFSIILSNSEEKNFIFFYSESTPLSNKDLTEQEYKEMFSVAFDSVEIKNIQQTQLKDFDVTKVTFTYIRNNEECTQEYIVHNGNDSFFEIGYAYPNDSKEENMKYIDAIMNSINFSSTQNVNELNSNDKFTADIPEQWVILNQEHLEDGPVIEYTDELDKDFHFKYYTAADGVAFVYNEENIKNILDYHEIENPADTLYEETTMTKDNIKTAKLEFNYKKDGKNMRYVMYQMDIPNMPATLEFIYNMDSEENFQDKIQDLISTFEFK